MITFLCLCCRVHQWGLVIAWWIKIKFVSVINQFIDIVIMLPTVRFKLPKSFFIHRKLYVVNILPKKISRKFISWNRNFYNTKMFQYRFFQFVDFFCFKEIEVCFENKFIHNQWFDLAFQGTISPTKKKKESLIRSCVKYLSWHLFCG